MKKIFPISAFEFSYWKRRPAPYVTYLIIFTFSLLLFTLDQFSVNNSSEMSFKNSPSVLVNLYTVIILFAPIFINQYISFSVSRDFEYKFHELIYSYPVPRNSLFLGRFIGSLAVVIFILSAPILADLLAPIVPWSDAERLKPFNLINHLWCFAFILLPNIWIIGWILFYFTSLLKSTRYAIMISIGMVGIYLSFLQLTNNLSNTLIPALTDPFGIIPISLIQDKQSVFEQNHFFPALDYKYYLNRIIWIGISIVFYALSVKSLEKKYTKSSYHAPKVKQDTKTYIPKSNLEISKSFGIVHSLRVIHEEARSGIRFFFTGNIFIVFISTVFLILLLRYVGAIHTDDATPFATTYHTLNKFVPILYIMKFYIIFMIAEIFWRDKEFFFQDIKYSLPANPKSIFMGKVLSVIYYYVIVSAILMVCGIIYQLLKGDAPIDIGHYLFFFFVIHFFSFLFLSIFSFFLQNFLSNKFMAMALTAVILLAQPIIKSAWEIKSNMVGILPSLPNLIYSDFYGYEPYLKHYFAFQCYWFLIYLVLLYITACTFFGQDKISLKEKFLLLKQNFKSDKIFFPFLIIITSVHAGILYYQTQIKNEYLSSKEEKRRSAEYEKRFKKYTHIPMPKVTHADFKIDLFGKERKFVVRAEITLKNKTKQEIKEIYFTNFLKNSIPLRIENAKIILNDSTTIVKFQGFKLNKPMAPGDSLILKYTYEYKEEGLHNELPNERLLPNGTFLSMNYFTPNIGYVENYELSDNSERKKYGLPIKTEIFPTLEKNCFENCMNNYVSQSDWATVHTIISTYQDQIAIAPGTLIKEGKEKNRNIF
ncbi:MAG: ABC transporter permease [Bacteroidia bacterium]|nr:ABC transporter permease [Bacteroidia bacterium]